MVGTWKHGDELHGQQQSRWTTIGHYYYCWRLMENLLMGESAIRVGCPCPWHRYSYCTMQKQCRACFFAVSVHDSGAHWDQQAGGLKRKGLNPSHSPFIGSHVQLFCKVQSRWTGGNDTNGDTCGGGGSKRGGGREGGRERGWRGFDSLHFIRGNIIHYYYVTYGIMYHVPVL